VSYTPPVYNAVNFDDVSGTYTPPAYNAVNFDGSDPGSVILAGQTTTVSSGTLFPSIAITPAGIAATASPGTLGITVAVVLTGLQASAAVGILSATVNGNATVPLVGSSVTASGGVLVPALAVTLTTQFVTVSGGLIFPTLQGLQVAVSGGTLVPVITRALVGQAATVTQGVLFGGVNGDLVSIAAVIAYGPLVPTITFALTGLSAAASGGTLVPTVAPAFVGLQATASGGAVGTITYLTGIAATVSGGTLATDRRYANPIIWSSSSHFSLSRFNNSTDSKDRTVYGSVVGPFVGIASYDGTTTGYRKEGKWYVEFVDRYGSPAWYAGIIDSFRVVSGAHLGLRTAGGDDLTTWAFGLLPSTIVTTHDGTSTAQGSHTSVAGDVVMMAIDLDAGLVWFGLNGTWLGGGNPFTGANPTYTGVSSTHPMTPASSIGNATSTLNGVYIRAALDAMTYTIPGGFQPWETSNLNNTKALTGLSATVSGGLVGAFEGVGVLTTLVATASGGTLTPLIQITGVLVGQSMTIRQGPFAVISAGANKSVQLYGLAVTTSVGVFTPTVIVGATGAVTTTPAVVQSTFTGGGDAFPPAEAFTWATKNNFISYDGMLLGAGDTGYLDVSANWAVKRAFGYSLDQTTRGKTWGHTPWSTSTWDAPGDVNRFNAFFGGIGDHFVAGQVYDFSGPSWGHGGQFSVDLDGNLAFVHMRGYGLVAGRKNTTPDLVYYLQVSDLTQVVWRRDNFALDAAHELLMGVYGHTAKNTLVFYPSLSGTDWVPTVRRWDGTTLSTATQLTGFTGNAACDAAHKCLCVTRAGYGDTIYVSYYSSTGHVGLIVMDAVTLSVTSHVLTATVATGSVFTILSFGGFDLASEPPTRSLAEVVYLNSGTSVTQFLLNQQFVRLSWTSGTATTPTQTLKTGPSSSYLVGGWETLETKGEEVVHVLYERTVVSTNYNSGTGRYDYLQDFKVFANDATGTGSSWTDKGVVWSWTESFTLNQLDYKEAIWFSGYGGGLQSVLYSVPLLAVGKGDSETQAKLAWFDYWAKQAPYMSVKATGRVGRVSITIIPGVVLVGLQATVSPGTLTPNIAVTLTGLSATATGGTIAGVIPVDATVPLFGLSMAATRGSLVAGVGVTLTGIAASAVGSTLIPTNSPALVSNSLTTSRGTLLPTIAVALIGLQASAQGGALAVTCGVNLTGQSLAATSGVIVPTLSVRLIGAQLQTGYGIFIPLNSPLLTGAVMAALEGSLQVVMTVPLVGRQASLVSGTLGFLYDCNVFPLGVYALGVVSPEPTLTNVPPIGENLQLWARAEVEKLFAQESFGELFNDVEPPE